MTTEKLPYLVMASADELAAFAKNNAIESYRDRTLGLQTLDR